MSPAGSGWVAALRIAALVISLAGSLPGALAGATARAEASITHGRDVQVDRVGPAAGGFQPRDRYDGAIVKDGVVPPFARRIEWDATYDGVPVAGPHLLIDSVTLSGGLDIYTALPVVIRGSTVRPRSDALWAIHMRPTAGPLYLLWSDIGGGEGARVNVALLLRANGATVYRSRISNALDGIRMTASGYRIRETLIDDLVTRPKDHNDGIQTSPEARDVVVSRTRIMNRNPQTSCLLIRGSDMTIEDSYLAGGGWVIYGGLNGNGHSGASSAGLRVSNTIFGRDYFPKAGHFGLVTYWGPGNLWTANTFDDGAPVLVREDAELRNK